MKFRKKPVVIEARQLTAENALEVAEWCGAKRSVYGDLLWGTALPIEQRSIVIETLEGDHCGNMGDWIIKGIKGEFYPCRPDIFEMTYEKVEE